MNKYILTLFIGLSILSSCTEYRKVKKSDDVDLKFTTAEKLFDAGDFHKTIILLDDIVPYLRGDKRAEKGQFMYAKCHFGQKRYIEAAYYFKSFIGTYSRSPFAEEAQYLEALSLFKQSPWFGLDQTPTKEALVAFQAMLDKYPNTIYKEQITTYMDVNRKRLEDKAFSNAMLYYKIRKYDPRALKSAIISLNNFELDFPESKRMQEVGYVKLDAMFQLAQISTFGKKADRFKEFEEHYLSYIEEYSDSEYIKKAESLYARSNRELNKIDKLN